MPARVGRLSAGVGCRRPVTIRKASLMAGSMRRARALQHQIGAQYSVVECTKVRVAIRKARVAIRTSKPPRARDE